MVSNLSSATSARATVVRAALAQAGVSDVISVDVTEGPPRACSQASQRGVRGVPYFVVQGREDARPIGFSGAVDAPQLVEIFGEVL